MMGFSFPPAVSADEIAARMRYDNLPLRERLVTPPPRGYNGAYLARITAPTVKWLVWLKDELSIVDNHGP